MTKLVSVIPVRPVAVMNGQAFEARKRVCAYCRVSTDTVEQQSSYDAQVDYYTTFIKNNPEWDFVDVYADDGITGTNTKKRDEFNRMISNCVEGKIDMIITKSISRFARNTLDCLKYVRFLREKGIAVFFEKEKINTLDSKGEVLLTILSSLAQDESRNISENSRWGIIRRFQQGKVRVNHKRFMGYDKDQNGELVINEEQSRIVRRIFSEYIEGRSALQIARGLMKSGIKTVDGNTMWWDTTIMKMLSNEKYAGDALLQKTVTVDFLTHKKVVNRGQEQQYFIEGNHPPIISKEMFQLVQQEKQRRSSKRRKTEGEGSKYSSKYVMTGRIYCSVCGTPYVRRIWRSTSYGRKAVWQCRKYVKAGPEACSSKAVDEFALKDAFTRMFNRIYEHRAEFVNILTVNIRKVLSRETDEGRLKEVDEKIMELKNELKALIRLQTKSNLDGSIYSEEYMRISSELETMKRQKEELDKDTTFRQNLKERMDEIISILDNTKDLLKEFDEGLFDVLVDRVTIISQAHFRFELKSGIVVEES